MWSPGAHTMMCIPGACLGKATFFSSKLRHTADQIFILSMSSGHVAWIYKYWLFFVFCLGNSMKLVEWIHFCADSVSSGIANSKVGSSKEKADGLYQSSKELHLMVLQKVSIERMFTVAVFLITKTCRQPNEHWEKNGKINWVVFIQQDM